ncbi:MAG: SIR2 family protein, partial [Salinivirgaceae bacterium]|nr:SIR2 family protein [Salinivirgaceae bacterium]
MVFRNTTVDIPEDLLRAHAEGRVVFFCGAGISRDAGIPVFGELLKRTAKKLNHELSACEKQLDKQEKYDQLFLMYEREFGDAIRVRKAAAECLYEHRKVDDDSLSKHISLLQLSQLRNGKARLVTTNYDNLFDEAQRITGGVQEFKAPFLPVPKEYKWNGIIYLHGKLLDSLTDDNLNSLVISSGDFGLAYLTERWASRFLTELFRDYVICFVGYSINDVVIKYMMDALASERMRGEEHLQVYAFAGYERAGRAKCISEWWAKGVEAIPYKVTSKNGHGELTRVLQEWAKSYEMGRMDKVGAVRLALQSEPDAISKDGRQTVARFLWALKDEIRNDDLPEPTSTTAKWLEHIPAEVVQWKNGDYIIGWISRHIKFPECLHWFVRCCSKLNIDHYGYFINTIPIDADNGKYYDLWRLYLLNFWRKHT